MEIDYFTQMEKGEDYFLQAEISDYWEELKNPKISLAPVEPQKEEPKPEPPPPPKPPELALEVPEFLEEEPFVAGQMFIKKLSEKYAL